MKFLFWFSALFILYTYAGYPLLLFVWSRLFPRKVRKAPLSPEPRVSVVIAARDEEWHMGSRIENLREQDYPPGNLEIIIVSDGSTDGTNRIVRRFARQKDRILPRVRLVELKRSKGKSHAINRGVETAKGEFIVFSDARQRFEPNVIRELVANFNDPHVGCVSGELVLDGEMIHMSDA
jgi:cellulose synthase/poly-beta-1,6-N-acetylglucosamine synthase-like glycosyltransferase